MPVAISLKNLKMKIVLIDNDKMVLYIHTKLLKKLYENAQIETYNCPKQFIEKIENNKNSIPDMILSDYHMDNFNGLWILNRLEEIRKTKAISDNKLLFFFVSSDIDNISQNCSSQLLKGYFKKPLNKNILSDLLSKNKLAS